MEHRYNPMHDRVLVRRHAPEERTEGGLYIPEKAKNKATMGTVLAVGPGAHVAGCGFVETTVKPGAVVLFGKYSGSELAEGDDLIVMREGDILAVDSGVE